MAQAPAPAILLVDDSPDDCFFTRRALTRLGLDGDVQVVGDSVQALASLAAARFELILLDWHLPGEDGERVLAAVRQAAGPDALIVVLSGRDDDAVRVEALAGGARAVLGKPLEPEALRPLLPPAITANAPA